MFIHFLGILSYLGVTSWYKSKTKILMLEYNLLKKNFKAYGILQARILEWVVVPFSRGIFPTQGLNPGLQHCRWILNLLSHQGSPDLLPGNAEKALPTFHSQLNMAGSLFFRDHSAQWKRPISLSCSSPDMATSSRKPLLHAPRASCMGP